MPFGSRKQNDFRVTSGRHQSSSFCFVYYWKVPVTSGKLLEGFFRSANQKV